MREALIKYFLCISLYANEEYGVSDFMLTNIFVIVHIININQLQHAEIHQIEENAQKPIFCCKLYGTPLKGACNRGVL